LLLAILAASALRADDGAIQCANLIYGGTHTSRCFSDEFLSAAQRQTTIPTERRFKSVKLGSDELFTYPFVVMTGEATFQLTPKERGNLKTYVEKGGFLLASAGCSSSEWDQSFRRELRTVFEADRLTSVPMAHPVFSTVKKIEALKTKHGAGAQALEGIEHNGKLVAIYSKEGLNDTAHTEGCCCCGGNEISNSLDVMVNIFVYALLH
jgi:hypothetical protein